MKITDNNSLKPKFVYQKAKKGFRCQKPIYRSIAEFVNLVSNHPELSRDANFPEDEEEMDYIPYDKIDEIEHLSSFFAPPKRRGRQAEPLPKAGDETQPVAQQATQGAQPAQAQVEDPSSR